MDAIRVADEQIRADESTLSSKIDSSNNLLDALKTDKNSISKSSPIGKLFVNILEFRIFINLIDKRKSGQKKYQQQNLYFSCLSTS